MSSVAAFVQETAPLTSAGEPVIMVENISKSGGEMAIAEGSYILALDGGQSSTICVLGSADGTLLGAGRGTPFTRPFQAGGSERIRRALESAIDAALATIQPPGRL